MWQVEHVLQLQINIPVIHYSYPIFPCTGAELYKRLTPYILTETQLKENNFPRTDPERGGTAVLYGEDQKAALKASIKGKSTW